MNESKNEKTAAALCGICDLPAVDEIAPGKPVCAACLALPVEERRAAGLRRMRSDEQRGPSCWHYLSFADERGFLGACWVVACGVIDACQTAHARGCNPGGSVMCRPLPAHGDPPAGSGYVLHKSKAEISRLFEQWTARIN